MYNIFTRAWRPMPTRTDYAPPFNRPAIRIATALAYGAVCHALFGIAALTMVLVMASGMSWAQGSVPWPFAYATNALLIAQFPLAHSYLLSARGRRHLARLSPATLGRDLASTIYVTIAALQIFLLFAFWTPSGIVWWQADGTTLWIWLAAYATAWGLLGKASFDAGVEVQSGALGWVSVARGVVPTYPAMPTTGLFSLCRQPIYVAFELTLWTTPTWTPDQLAVALSLTTYCIAGPLLKEERFARAYGKHFDAYRQNVPYWFPRWPRSTNRPQH